MKKYVNELNECQLIIYEYLKKNVTNNGTNLIDTLMELNDSYETTPDNVYRAYQSINDIEVVEVIHFFTRYLMRKN